MPRKDPACFLNRVRKKMAVPFPLLCSFPQPGVPGNGWLPQAPHHWSAHHTLAWAPQAWNLPQLSSSAQCQQSFQIWLEYQKYISFTQRTPQKWLVVPKPVPPHPLTQNWPKLSSSAFSFYTTSTMSTKLANMTCMSKLCQWYTNK